MSINLNSENILKLTSSKQETVLCEALLYFKYFIFTCLEIFLSLFRLQCKDYHCFTARPSNAKQNLASEHPNTILG